MKVVIVGLGSIGKRHTENLKGLGCEVVTTDIKDELKFDVDCAFICTPTQSHIDIAIEYLKRDIPVFIEKPLTWSLSELVKIEPYINKICMVGCNLRFHPSIIKAKTIAESKKVIFARAETGYYLPFWRQTDYKKSYSASEYGGIVLDAIHEPDYLYWLFGNFKHIKIVCDKVSDLEIKKEDIAEIGIIFESGVSASVHMDYLMKNYHRKLDLYLPHEVISFKIQPTNIMYKKEVEHFLRCVTEKKLPTNSLSEAIYVTQKILESRGNYSSQVIKHPTSQENQYANWE
jgi:predicted dehydrogenase